MHTQFQFGGIQLIIITPVFFLVSANFLNVPSNDYNMHTYVWLVFALNIIFKLVWENLPCIMLPLYPTHTHNSA